MVVGGVRLLLQGSITVHQNRLALLTSGIIPGRTRMLPFTFFEKSPNINVLDDGLNMISQECFITCS